MPNSNIQNALGNSIDIRLRNNIIRNYSEIRADIPISQYESIRVWGQVRDASGNPVPYALLKLVRTSESGNCYTGVAHTTADCQGFYQFDLCVDEGAEYKILASKSNNGDELTMQNGGNCPATQDTPCPNASTFSMDCNFND